MHYTRKKFLTVSASALAATLFSNQILGCTASSKMMANNPFKNFGIQLYTLRDIIEKDPKGVLKQLASFGYKQLESYETQGGLFFGMKPKEFKTYIQDLGMTCVSSHCNVNVNFEQKVEEALAAGLKYVIDPHVGAQKSLDDYKKIADKFNRLGSIAKKMGAQFGYHNHAYSFTPLNNVVPQEIFMNDTDKNLVTFEMDIFWVVAAGHNPEEWFKKYPGRFDLVHVKDRSKLPGKNDGLNSVDIGTGSINFKKLLPIAQKYGVKHFIVEQEFYPNGTSIQAAKVDADYMKMLK